MLIQLPNCPNVGAARLALREALTRVGGSRQVNELDVTDPRTPTHLSSWGSPTILIDGVDVAGDHPSEPCCRLYPGSEARGVPSPRMIEAALVCAQGSPGAQPERSNRSVRTLDR
jgi:hypothetical protein